MVPNTHFVFCFRDWFPLTSSKQGPPYLGTDGPFVWTLTDPGEVVCDDEAVDSRPPKVDVQVRYSHTLSKTSSFLSHT